MKVEIFPGRAAGSVTAPPSKSYSHRMLLCAALAGAEAVVENVSGSEDIRATLNCIRAFGGEFSREENQTGILRGIAEFDRFVESADPADCLCGESCPIVCPCGESGSTLRFLLPIALALRGGAVFTGSKRLMERGIGVYEEVLGSKGVRFDKNLVKYLAEDLIKSSNGVSAAEPGRPVPGEFILRGDVSNRFVSNASVRVSGRLEPGEYVLRGDVSSQFVSGLLFALPLQDGDSVLTVLPPVESRSYISMTLETLRLAGIKIIIEEKISEEQSTEEKTRKEKIPEEKSSETADSAGALRFLIPGRQKYTPRVFRVEGDWSNAAFLQALNFMGGNVRISGLNPDSLQGDRVCLRYFEKLSAPGAEIDLSDCPDLGPVLFAMAARGQGGTFTGIRRLRIKESDRVQAMAEELAKFGVRTVTEENRAVILPGGLHTPKQEFYGHNDHRIVMALSLLCTETGGTIHGAEAVRKSWPEFFDVLRTLGVKIRQE